MKNVVSTSGKHGESPGERVGRLRSRTIAVRALSEQTRESMWSLFQSHYTGTTREQFERDLDEKDHVILLLDTSNGRLAGFSTLKVLRVSVQGKSMLVVQSGDTIVARCYWGQTSLQWTFLAFVMRLRAVHPFTPIYWFLISKGYRTYLLLSRNFPEYWPRYDRRTPPFQRAIIESLVHRCYPHAIWHATRGVLEFRDPHERLREHVAPVEPSMLRYPDIRFFLERNPGHENGDELCCIGRVGLDLCTLYVQKRLRRLLRLPSRAARFSPHHER